MVIETNIIQRVQETIMRHMTLMGSNVFNVRVGDIEFMSVQPHTCSRTWVSQA